MQSDKSGLCQILCQEWTVYRRHGSLAKRAKNSNSDTFHCFNSAVLHGFLVKSCGTLIERNRFSSSWLIPSKLFESVAYWGLNHHLNSCLFRMPLQTQCIQSIGKLSEMSTNWRNTFSLLMPNTVVPLASPILPNILVSCAVLTATVPEGQFSYSLTCICPSEWLYLPGCLHVLQPNLPLCCLILF